MLKFKIMQKKKNFQNYPFQTVENCDPRKLEYFSDFY